MSSRPTESVWDYPRPPRIEPDDREIVIEHGGRVIARTTQSVRVLETSHPPAFYLPREDIADGLLEPSGRRTVCEFKGAASYFDVQVDGERITDAAWTYERPSTAFASLAGFVSFYPGRFDRCTVDGEVVEAQEGDFYGGWITGEVEGPFKGGPGTFGW